MNWAHIEVELGWIGIVENVLQKLVSTLVYNTFSKKKKKKLVYNKDYKDMYVYYFYFYLVQ